MSLNLGLIVCIKTYLLPWSVLGCFLVPSLYRPPLASAVAPRQPLLPALSSRPRRSRLLGLIHAVDKEEKGSGLIGGLRGSVDRV